MLWTKRTFSSPSLRTTHDSLHPTHRIDATARCYPEAPTCVAHLDSTYHPQNIHLQCRQAEEQYNTNRCHLIALKAHSPIAPTTTNSAVVTLKLLRNLTYLLSTWAELQLCSSQCPGPFNTRLLSVYAADPRREGRKNCFNVP